MGTPANQNRLTDSGASAASSSRTLVVQGGEIHTGAGGIDARLEDHLTMVPNIDRTVIPYAKKDSNFWGSSSAKGAVQLANVVQPAALSEGPIRVTTQDINLTAALLQTQSTAVDALHLTAHNTHLGVQNITQEAIPEVSVKGLTSTTVTGTYQEGTPSALMAPHGGIQLHNQGQLTGNAPVMMGDSILTRAASQDIRDNVLTQTRFLETSGVSGLAVINQSVHQRMESSQKPLYLSNTIRSESTAGDNRQVAPQMVTPITGAVSLGAYGGDVLLEESVTTTTTTSESSSTGISNGVTNGIVALLNGEGVASALAQIDPLASQLRGVFDSQSAASRSTKLISTGVQALKDINTFSQALSSGGIGQSLLNRYGNVSIGHQETRNRQTTTQSTGPVVQTGTFTVYGDQRTVLGGGIQADVDVFNVNVPRLEVPDSVNTSHASTSSSGGSIGYNVFTGTPSASVNHQEGSSQVTTHNPAQIRVRTAANFNNVAEVLLEGGQIHTPQATGRIGHLDVVSHQDMTSSRSAGGSIGYDGNLNLSGNFNQGHSATTNHHAGLFIADTQVQVDQLRVTDTQLAPEMARLSNQVTFTPLDDNQSSSGVSVALNGLNVNSLSDFGQSLGNNLTSAGAGVLAAEAVRAAEGGDVLSSLAGSSASALTSSYLNQLSANDNHERRAAAGGYAPSGLETMGQISYHRNGLETHLALVDVNGELLRENIARLDLAVDMLSQPEGVLIPELIEDDMVPLATALKEIRQDLEEIQQRVSGRQQGVKKASKRPLQASAESSFASEFPSVYEQALQHLSEADLSSLYDQTVEVLETHQQRINFMLEERPLTQTARAYLVALKDVLVEQIHDIVEHPLSYGIAIAEVLPGGIGTATSMGRQGYDIAQGTQTVDGAVGTLAVEGAMGYVGGKFVKASWKFVKGIGTKTIQKLHANRVAERLIKENNFKTVNLTDTGITWGKGIQQQGLPWEEYLAKSLPAHARLPKNFKTFDFYDRKTMTAISAKTLNTGSAKKIADPTKVYQSLKKNIDKAASFVEHRLSKRELTSEIISIRRLEVAIPKNTTFEQWKQIEKAMEYSKGKGVEFNITMVK